MIQSVSENTAVFFNLPGGLTVERLRTQGGWPKLGGKAAQLRHCARFASEVAGQHDSGSAHDRRRLAVVQLLVRFYDLVEHGDMFFNSAQCRDLVSIGRNLPVLYSQLAAEAAAAGKKLWKAQPKLHLFCHLCEWQIPLRLNPRMYWTYGDEDLVGKLIEVASSCHPFTVHFTALFKWLHVSFKDS